MRRTAGPKAHGTAARRAGVFLMSRHQRGQGMVEYLVLGAIVLALVAMPVDGANSALELLLQAVRTGYDKFLGAISLPQ